MIYLYLAGVIAFALFFVVFGEKQDIFYLTFTTLIWPLFILFLVIDETKVIIKELRK